MQKFSQSVEALLKKMGVTLTPEQKADLADGDVEISEKAQKQFDEILNKHLDEFKGKGKGEGKKEAFDATDKALANLKASLSGIVDEAEFDAILKEQGIETKLTKLGAKLAEAKTKLGKADGSADVKKFEEQVRDLNAQIKTLTEGTQAKVEEAVKKREAELGSQLFEKELVNRALGHAGISDEIKKGRHFKTLLSADFTDIAAKKGVKVDPFTLKVEKADGSGPLFVKNNEVTFDTLLTELAELEDYKKKSDGPPPKGQVGIGDPPPPGSGNAVASALAGRGA